MRCIKRNEMETKNIFQKIQSVANEIKNIEK